MIFEEFFYTSRMNEWRASLKEAMQANEAENQLSLQVSQQAFEYLWRRTAYIRFASSTMSMTFYLLNRTPFEQLVAAIAAYTLPQGPLLLTLEAPVVPRFETPNARSLLPVKGLHWICMNDPRLADMSASGRVAQSIRSLLHRDPLFLLNLVTEDADTVFSLAYAPEQGRWGLSPVHVCPFGRCSPTDGDETCEQCRLWCASWSMVFPLLLMVKDRLFAQPRQQTEQVVRRVERQHSGKKRTVAVSYSYSVIDASHLTRREVRRSLFPRGSWLQRHAPEEIAYEDRAARAYARTYRHERYTHMRGQTQEIRPRKLRHTPVLKSRQRITSVIASSYAAVDGGPTGQDGRS
jgi:hypothetical protein